MAMVDAKRVLIVDDDCELLDTLAEMLDGAGFTVAKANNGAEGIAAYKKTPADVVILDMLMPEKDGFETMNFLKRDYPDVKIIAMTGGGTIGSQDVLQWARLMGVTRAFSKPFQWEEMLQSVQQITNATH